MVESAADGLVVEGTPEEVAECEASWTGRYLRESIASAGTTRTTSPRSAAIGNLTAAPPPRGDTSPRIVVPPRPPASVQLDEFRWQLPREGGMRVPGLIIADRLLLERMMDDKTFQQVKNAAHLPGILTASIAMPDAHWGYGLPVGGVVATDEHDGVISPGAVRLRHRLRRADAALAAHARRAGAARRSARRRAV